MWSYFNNPTSNGVFGAHFRDPFFPNGQTSLNVSESKDPLAQTLIVSQLKIPGVSDFDVLNVGVFGSFFLSGGKCTGGFFS